MKVVVITGITGSVGRGIFLRLGREFFRLKVYGTARSYERASDAFRTLANRDPSLTRRIINGDVVLAPAILDTTDIATVRAFAKRLVEENSAVDLLILNAGAIISTGLCWPSAIRQFFTDIREFPLRPNYIIYDGGRYTSSGIAVSFCTNVYGHYLLAELLQPLLAAALDARVIWVGSSEGEGRYFSSSDIEGRKSINPYGSNKFCLQIVSKWLNDRYQTLKLPIRSVVTTPGIVPSNLAASLIPPFLVPLLVPLFWLLRLIWNLQELTITGETSAEAVVYVATVPIEQLEVGFRVDSICSRLGVPAIRLTAIPELSAASVLATQRHLNDLNARFSIDLRSPPH